MNIVKILFVLFNVSSYTPGKINPENYILGPGDKILIVSNTTGQNINTIVTPGGYAPLFSLQFASTSLQSNQPQSTSITGGLLVSGIIKAAGLSIKDFEDSLSVFVYRKFGKTDSFNVILIKPRTVGIEVGGAVLHPGIYMLPANLTIADAIWAAGGFTGLALHSKVLLISKNDTLSVNLSTFENLKSSKYNPSISGFNKILVPYVNPQKSVYIAGEITAVPLSSSAITIYNDTSGTLPITIKTKSISVRIDSQITIKNLLNKILVNNLQLKISEHNVLIKHNGRIHMVNDVEKPVFAGDSVYILPLFRGIVVAGEVMRPGTLIPFAEGASLEYYIARAGGKTSLSGSTEIVRGFRTFKASAQNVPQDGDIIIVKYSKTRRFAEYVGILQGILTLVTLYLAYNK